MSKFDAIDNALDIEVVKEAEEILDVKKVVASILLVQDLRIQKE